MILNHEQQKAIENGKPWTIEEMNLLADEAEAMISRGESDEHLTRPSHQQHHPGAM